MDLIWVLGPDDGWTLAKNNEFVESGLENRVRMSWATNKVNSIDKNREVDGVNPNKILHLSISYIFLASLIT